MQSDPERVNEVTIRTLIIDSITPVAYTLIEGADAMMCTHPLGLLLHHPFFMETPDLIFHSP